MTTLTQQYKLVAPAVFPYYCTLYVQDESYANIQSGVAAVAVPDNGSQLLHIYAANYSPAPIYYASQVFIQFDTSAIGAGDSAVLKMGMAIAGAIQSAHPSGKIHVYAYDWGSEVTMDDWQTPTDLAGLTLVATVDYGDISTGDYVVNTFDDVALLSNINFGGFSRFLLVIKDFVDEVTPDDYDYVNLDLGTPFYQRDATGGLEVTYDGVAVSAGGDQPAASGGLDITIVGKASVAGAQDAPEGDLRFLTPPSTMEGDQDRPSGALAVDRLLTHIAVSGNQPAPSGSIDLESLASSLPRRELPLRAGSARRPLPMGRASIRTKRDGTV